MASMAPLTARITRLSTCETFGLPDGISCEGCVGFQAAKLNRPNKKRNRDNQRFSCRRPFDSKYEHHFLESKRATYQRWVDMLSTHHSHDDDMEEMTEGDSGQSQNEPMVVTVDDASPLPLPSPARAVSPPNDIEEDTRFGTYDVEVLPGHWVYNIPNTHEIKTKSANRRRDKQAHVAKSAMKALVPKTMGHNTNLSVFIQGIAMSQSPGLSHYALQPLLALDRAAVVANMEDCKHEHLVQAAAATRSASTLKVYTRQAAADCMIHMQQELLLAPCIYGGFDKGNKAGFEHLAKGVSFYCDVNNRVKHYCLDVDASGSSTTEVADAIDRTLERLDTPDRRLLLAGQTTDSGGGGVLDDLADSLGERQRTDQELYFVARCSIHNQQKALENGILTAFGDGGVDKRTPTQLLFACYQMQQQLQGELFRKTWRLVNPDDVVEENLHDDDGLALYDGDEDLKRQSGNRIGTPVTTRWWTTVLAAIHVTENWREWMNIASKVVDANKNKTLRWKVASDAYSLLCEEEIKSDLLFLAAFGKDFFLPTLKWLQGTDEHAKLYGHRSRSMAEFTFRIDRLLQSLRNGGWRQRDDYKAFIDHLSTEHVCVETQEKKVSLFLETYAETAMKHFSSWLTTPNVVCAIGGESVLASAFSNWILNGSLPSEETTLESSTHDGYIFNIRDYIDFIATYVTRTELIAFEWTTHHQRALELMATGASIWHEITDNTDTSLLALLQFVKYRILPLMSSTHWIEYLIKETSLAATSRRDEGMRSAIVMIRSIINPDVSLRSQSNQKRAPRGVI